MHWHHLSGMMVSHNISFSRTRAKMGNTGWCFLGSGQCWQGSCLCFHGIGTIPSRSRFDLVTAKPQPGCPSWEREHPALFFGWERVHYTHHGSPPVLVQEHAEPHCVQDGQQVHQKYNDYWESRLLSAYSTVQLCLHGIHDCHHPLMSLWLLPHVDSCKTCCGGLSFSKPSIHWQAQDQGISAWGRYECMERTLWQCMWCNRTKSLWMCRHRNHKLVQRRAWELTIWG